MLDLATSNSQLLNVKLLSLSFTTSPSTIMKLLLLFSLAINLAGSALIDIDDEDAWNDCDDDDIVVIYQPAEPKREFPCSMALDWFIMDEAVNRLRYPERTTVTLSGDLDSRLRKGLFEWKNLSQEDFVEGALQHLDLSICKTIEMNSDAAPLKEVTATFEGEGGDEFRTAYCLTFYHSLQQVPDSEWRLTTLRK